MTGGLAWFALPCSNWVFLSRSFSCRSRQQPLGDETKDLVRLQNILVSRIVKMLYYCVANNIYWVIEQPVSSCMLWHPRLAAAARHIGLRRVFFWQRAYGAESPKGTLLFGNAPWLERMCIQIDKAKLCTPTHLQIVSRESLNCSMFPSPFGHALL